MSSASTSHLKPRSNNYNIMSCVASPINMVNCQALPRSIRHLWKRLVHHPLRQAEWLAVNITDQWHVRQGLRTVVKLESEPTKKRVTDDKRGCETFLKWFSSPKSLKNVQLIINVYSKLEPRHKRFLSSQADQFGYNIIGPTLRQRWSPPRRVQASANSVSDCWNNNYD